MLDQSQIDAFNLDGVIVVPDVLPGDVLAAVRAEYAGLLDTLKSPQLRQQAAVPPSAQTKAVTKGSVKTKVSASDAQHAKYRPLVYRVEHIAMETADVEDELWEPILYLPSKPSVATLVDGLVVQPTPDGRWQAPSTAICYLLGPLSVLATNLVCASNYRYD